MRIGTLKGYRAVKLVALLGVFSLGLLVIFGWHLNSKDLVQILPGLVPMQYNTALCFLLLACCLVLIFKDKFPGLRWVLLSVVALISGLTVLEYAFDVNLGLDELFMDHHITVKTSHPGRNVKVTTRVIDSILSTCILGLGLIAIAGYFTGQEYTYGWGRYTQMAVHTAVGFVLTGIFFTITAWWDEDGLLSSSKNVGMVTAQAIVLTITLALVDISLPLGVAAGVIYIALVLFSWLFYRQYMILVCTGVATALIILGYFFSPDGIDAWKGIPNRVLAIIAIWAVGILLYMVKRQSRKLKDNNRNLELMVQARTKELDAKNKELERFVYIASHDLQEPLRTIRSFTGIIEKKHTDKFDGETKQIWTFISAGAARMSDLIHSLLDHTRIGAQKQLETVEIKTLLEEVTADLNLVIQEVNGSISYGLMPTMACYPVELRLLFQNLISNALKFTKKGVAPQIEVASSHNHDFWEFSVRDNGIGIAEKDVSKIFEVFQRLHQRDEYEGVGIGLSHCKKIVELHEGRIWVESEPGVGSTFYFTIKNLLNEK